ncbi:carbonic anhydrase [Nostocoides jenkinsii]|uniref:Carbonic anhydrase n=1 Tax=Nostocoides jenkinsii Ben 74 TaxID=1193518 RepID=A0A077M4J1_9MICO|nr:carbonic anhydrase [Tetrasphaera jenkinsii]CCI52191.1 Carbonic anhydrase [Tetrasphaera jenkinsii Ben 74]
MTVSPRHRAQPGTRPVTPEQAWQALLAGNARFMADERAHPHQDVHIRHRLADQQAPFAVLFGCGDSRVAAEIIFDQGLGDLFVVRTAGHVVDFSVLGSIEFGVLKLGTPLIVVLAHDSCGAVGAAVASAQSGEMPPGYIRDIVERITPSVFAVGKSGEITDRAVEREHARLTCALLYERSSICRNAVDAGRLAIVGCEYDLVDGQAHLVHVVGDIGDHELLLRDDPAE